MNDILCNKCEKQFDSTEKNINFGVIKYYDTRYFLCIKCYLKFDEIIKFENEKLIKEFIKNKELL